MKKISLFTITTMLVFALILAGCGGAPAAEAQPADKAVEAHADVQEQEEPAAVPTEAWEPIPCNVVFNSDRDGNREIYIMGPDGENPTNLTNSPTDDWNPAISPDGSRIAFVSFREDENGGGQFIYLMDADGGNVRQLTLEENSDFPDWSHDGKMITYTSNEDVYIISADGSSPTRLTESPEKDVFPTWSPDGSQIAWLSGQDGAMNIFVMGADGQNVHQITDNGSANIVEWTVDGRIFTDRWGWQDKEEFCHNCVVTTDGADIEDAGGKGEKQRYLPFWNGAGDRVELISTSLDGGTSEIYLVGEVFPDIFYNMTNNPAEENNPDWPANCGPDYTPNVQAELVVQPEQAEPAQAEQPKADQDIVIGYEGDPNAMTEQKLADIKQACDELDIQCVQAGSLAELAGQDVDAIISITNKWTVMGDWPQFQDVAGQGIPIYVVDAETDVPGVFNLSIGSAALDAGLRWMADQMGGEGELAYFNFGTNDFEEILIQEVLAEYPGIQAIAIPATYDDMSVASQEKIVEMMASKPELGAIWANEMQEDIFWAVSGSQGGRYPAILCSPRSNILMGWKNRVAADPAFNCFMTIKPGGNAYEAVYVAYYRLNGAELDPAAMSGVFGNSLRYDYPIITNDNLEEWIGKVGDLRKGEWDTLELPPMTPEEIKDKWFLE